MRLFTRLKPNHAIGTKVENKMRGDSNGDYLANRSLFPTCNQVSNDWKADSMCNSFATNNHWQWHFVADLE